MAISFLVVVLMSLQARYSVSEYTESYSNKANHGTSYSKVGLDTKETLKAITSHDLRAYSYTEVGTVQYVQVTTVPAFVTATVAVTTTYTMKPTDCVEGLSGLALATSTVTPTLTSVVDITLTSTSTVGCPRAVVTRCYNIYQTTTVSPSSRANAVRFYATSHTTVSSYYPTTVTRTAYRRCHMH